MNKSNSENQFQQLCFMHFHNNYPLLRGLLFHVDNNSIDGRVGKDKKSIGVIAGVSDFLFIYNKTVYCIELKVRRNTQSTNQIEWQALVEKQGVFYTVVRDLNEFVSLIKKIVNEQA